MLFYLTCLNAQNCLIVCDGSRTPLYSTEKFKTGGNQLLYECMFQYMLTFETTPIFYNFVMIVRRYMKQNGHLRDKKHILDEIKILFATNIMSRFELGRLTVDILGLIENFNDDLYSHLSNLCRFTMSDINLSGEKDMCYYEADDISINKSLSIIAVTYITYAYEILQYQTKHKRWCYTHDCSLEIRLGENVIKVRSTLEFIFGTDRDKCLCYNISFCDCLYKDLDLSEAHSFLSKNENTKIIIFLMYSCKEMLDKIKQKFKYGSIVQTPNIPLYNILLCNPNLCMLNLFYDQLRRNGKLKNAYVYNFRTLNKFELICMVNEDLSDGICNDWENGMNGAFDRIEALNQFTDDYINYANSKIYQRHAATIT